MTAFYDFFRKIVLKDPQGDQLVVLEADSVVDTMTIESGEGVSLGTHNKNTDTFKIDVDYDLYVPVGTTLLRLQDVNANTTDVSLLAGTGMDISRQSASELVLSSFGVAETDTLHTVSTRGRITDVNLVANGLTVGVVESVAGTDGMIAKDPEFIGDGTLASPLRLSDPIITTDPYSKSIQFTTEDSAGVLSYAVAIDPLEIVTAYSFTLEREDPASPGTYTIIESESASNSDQPIIATNTFEETFDGSVTWRLTVSVSGFSQDLEVQTQFQFEVFDLAADPVLETDNSAAAIKVRNILPAENEQFDIGSTSLRFNDLYLSGNSIFLGESKISLDVDGNFEFTNSDGNKAEVDLAANDTDDLTEGTSNLYYTDTRARSAVSATGDLSYSSSTGEFSFSERTDSEVRDLVSASGDLSYDSSTGEFSFSERTDQEVRGLVSASGDLSYNSTTGVFSFTERTDSEVRGLVSASGDLSYSSSTGVFSFTERTDQEVRGLVSASGDLSYNSTTGVFSFTERTDQEVRDLVSASGDLSYNSTTGVFSFTERTDSEVREILSAGGDLSYDSSTGEFSVTTYKSADFNTDFGNKSTDDLSEGTSNLYYTDTRARAAVSASGDLSYNSTTGVFSVTTYKSGDFNTDFGNKDTDDLSEGTSNLYYTDSRVDSHLSGGTGVTYSTGEISIGQAVATNDSVTFAGVSVSGLTSLQQTTEVLNTKFVASGVVDHDFSTGAIWYHINLQSDFTANFTNIPTTDNRAINVVLVLEQDSTPFIPTAVQINDVSQTINWSGAELPEGTANQTDIASFTFIRQNASWLVTGSLNTFG